MWLEASYTRPLQQTLSWLCCLLPQRVFIPIPGYHTKSSSFFCLQRPSGIWAIRERYIEVCRKEDGRRQFEVPAGDELRNDARQCRKLMCVTMSGSSWCRYHSLTDGKSLFTLICEDKLIPSIQTLHTNNGGRNWYGDGRTLGKEIFLQHKSRPILFTSG